MYSDDRLPTDMLVRAGLLACSAQAIPAYVIRKGDAQGGMVLLRLEQRDGVQLLSQTRDIDGNQGWMALFPKGPVDRFEADAAQERAISRDSDLWVIEIEHPDGWHPFEGDLL
ncbi:MAG: DUF1491 family protein [Alphaproteobacteria bacterium]